MTILKLYKKARVVKTLLKNSKIEGHVFPDIKTILMSYNVLTTGSITARIDKQTFVYMYPQQRSHSRSMGKGSTFH